MPSEDTGGKGQVTGCQINNGCMCASGKCTQKHKGESDRVKQGQSTITKLADPDFLPTLFRHESLHQVSGELEHKTH
ncbi:hypothetical protein NQZ68_035847 [Dissostichus eleginoides]|nr:hypothetical protein NQZ68_035847 [Dissostichus eleginoides]